MIKEIMKELKLNNEVLLECIDEKGFLNPLDCAGNEEANREILSQKQLKVSHTDICDTVYLCGELDGGSCNCINSNELKYFRISRKIDEGEEEMFEEIRKELVAKGKVVLECIDSKGLVKGLESVCKEWKNEVSKGVISVSGIDNQLKRVSFHTPTNLKLFLTLEDLKYFRIKDNEPTFNDLIDVAVQALKDGILTELEIREDRFISGAIKEGLSPTREFSTGSQSGGIAGRIQFIRNLYTESFTIEVEDDIIRINEDAKTVMMNGHKFHGNEFKEFASSDIKTLFSLLKGSMVTQKKE